MTVPEVAAQLRVDEDTVWRLLRDEDLPRVKVRAATRIPSEAVQAFIAAGGTA